MPRPIRLIVIHCSDSQNGRSLFSGVPGTPGFRDPAMEIDAWHRERGFHRDTYWRGRQNAALSAIGYHYVIGRNGALFTGRHEEERGAHAQGWNMHSIGLCLVGTDVFTPHQYAQLRRTLEGLAERLAVPLAPPVLATLDGKGVVRQAGVCGHRDLPGHRKACPGFDVGTWLAGGMATP